MRKQRKRALFSVIATVAQLLIVFEALAQEDVMNAAPPGGSLLILLMGLGAIFLVGLTFIVRERMGGSSQRENGMR